MAAGSFPGRFEFDAAPRESEFTMKVVVAVLGFLLLLPVLILVGIAMGPAILVILFISGIALLTVGLAWMLDRARTH
jgi:hypothetical protein